MLKLVRNAALLCLVLISGCADPTLPHRKALAIGLTEAVAWRYPDIASIPTDIQRMHLGAGQAAAKAGACESCLKTQPPFDAELIALIQAYAKSSRELEAQYNQAIADGRPALNEAEKEIALKCGRNDFAMFGQILERIKYDELAR